MSIVVPDFSQLLSLFFLTYSHEKGCIIDKNLTPKLRPMYIEFYVVYEICQLEHMQAVEITRATTQLPLSRVIVCVANPNKHVRRVLKTTH